jgi:hypothetical protein
MEGASLGAASGAPVRKGIQHRTMAAAAADALRRRILEGA